MSTHPPTHPPTHDRDGSPWPKHDWCARQHPVHCPDPETEPAPEPTATSDVETASLEVIARAGATKPQRDVVDIRVLDSVRNGTGRIIGTVAGVGGFPV